MNMNQKGFVPIIIIILIVVGVLAAGGGVYYWQKQKTTPVATSVDKTESPPTSQLNNSNKQNDRDTRRIQDLKFMDMYLGRYYQKYNNYPKISNSGDWDGLKNSLREVSEIDRISGAPVVSAMRNDPLFPKQNYLYGVSDDGQNYVLAATLENMNNYPARNLKALQKEDLDGIIYGINCNDSVYCIDKDYSQRGEGF